MGIVANGRAKSESTFVPSLIAKQQREPARDADERSQVENVSEMPTPMSQNPARLKEMLASMTWAPRAAINDIEQEIGLMRDLIAEREQALVEAIDQHANLSDEAVRGMGVVRKALMQIRDAFNTAMRPTPVLDHQAEATHPDRGGRDDEAGAT